MNLRTRILIKHYNLSKNFGKLKDRCIESKILSVIKLAIILVIPILNIVWVFVIIFMSDDGFFDQFKKDYEDTLAKIPSRKLIYKETKAEFDKNREMYGCPHFSRCTKSERTSNKCHACTEDGDIIDSVGGYHSEGCGWAPNGNFCGECSKTSCEGCKIAKRCK
jgi:hypothetical protein